MHHPILLLAVLSLASTLHAAAPATMATTSPATIPAGLGVNIHFTQPQPGEVEQLAAAGFTIVRMDFTWAAIEHSGGQYDWSEYEKLLNALQPHHIGALFILDYSNPLYDGDLAPHTDEGRAAFAAWAAAAVTHFKGRGILWEMYNEPNIHFWRPKPNADDYIKLALDVGKAIRAAAPEETYIGPATSTIDLKFLEACFKGGLLEYFSAVSVHPYRESEPETVAADYQRLRGLIAEYAPKDKTIPIYSGEWGYSSVARGVDAARQGKYLPRQWLTNITSGVPLSIWYDWHDDGPDPREPEHHFGTVLRDYKPKPAYLAAKTLTTQLGGYRFDRRLDLSSVDDYVLRFAKGDDTKLVAWTTGKPHSVTLSDLGGTFDVVSNAGERGEPIAAQESRLTIPLTDSPVYLTPLQK